MGTRVTKILGFGFADLNLNEDGELADPRLSPGAMGGTTWPITNYGEWLIQQVAEHPDDVEVGRDRYHFPLDANSPGLEERGYNYITLLDGEQAYGDHGVVVIRPYTFDDWRRYDDPFVHAELDLAGWPEDGMNTKVQLLPRNPFPYEGNIRRIDTGEALKSHWLSDLRSTSMRQDAPEIVNFAATKLGFRDVVDFDRQVYQSPPRNIEEMATWAGLFTDPDTARLMQPMIVTYWS